VVITLTFANVAAGLGVMLVGAVVMVAILAPDPARRKAALAVLDRLLVALAMFLRYKDIPTWRKPR
jgi:hypothetical protein